MRLFLYECFLFFFIPRSWTSFNNVLKSTRYLNACPACVECLLIDHTQLSNDSPCRGAILYSGAALVAFHAMY